MGMAKADFRSLSRVWSRSNLSKKRKLDIFAALVESKLLYGLSTAVYTKAESRRIDGFQSRCLRQLLKIPAAYISRVSNATVLQKCDVQALSQKLLDRQCKYFQKILQTDSNSMVKKVSFVSGLSNSLQPATSEFIRRRGRPSKEWIPETLYELRRRGFAE